MRESKRDGSRTGNLRQYLFEEQHFIFTTREYQTIFRSSISDFFVTLFFKQHIKTFFSLPFLCYALLLCLTAPLASLRFARPRHSLAAIGAVGQSHHTLALAGGYRKLITKPENLTWCAAATATATATANVHCCCQIHYYLSFCFMRFGTLN
jgi:hypothetical protein